MTPSNQRRLEELRHEIAIGLEELERGEGQPLDIEAIKAEGRKRLSQARRFPGSAHGQVVMTPDFDGPVAPEGR